MARLAKLTRRGALLTGGAAAGYVVGRSWAPGLSQLDGVPLAAEIGDRETILNDASELSAMPVRAHVRPAAHGDDLIAAFWAELAAARADGRCVNVGAARHSMGGQAIPRDGTAITVDDAWIASDTAARIYRVNGGARWSDVIAALDPLGYGPPCNAHRWWRDPPRSGADGRQGQRPCC